MGDLLGLSQCSLLGVPGLWPGEVQCIRLGTDGVWACFIYYLIETCLVRRGFHHALSNSQESAACIFMLCASVWWGRIVKSGQAGLGTYSTHIDISALAVTAAKDIVPVEWNGVRVGAYRCLSCSIGTSRMACDGCIWLPPSFLFAFQELLSCINKGESILNHKFLSSFLVQVNETFPVTRHMHSGTVNTTMWVGIQNLTVTAHHSCHVQYKAGGTLLLCLRDLLMLAAPQRVWNVGPDCQLLIPNFLCAGHSYLRNIVWRGTGFMSVFLINWHDFETNGFASEHWISFPEVPSRSWLS